MFNYVQHSQIVRDKCDKFRGLVNTAFKSQKQQSTYIFILQFICGVPMYHLSHVLKS